MKLFLFRLPLKIMIVITLVLVVLKLTDNLLWSWERVFLPLQLFLILGLFFALLWVLIERLQKDKKINSR
jgi:hypothetical protein